MKKELFFIIRAQIQYILYSIHHTFILLAGLFTYAYLREFNPLNLFCFLFFVQYASIVLLKANKENRDYTFQLLTLSAKQIASIRIILTLLGFVIIYLIAFLLHILFFNTTLGFRNSLHELFMFGGIALSGIFLYVIFSDYFSVFRNKSGFIWFNIIVGTIIGMLSFFIIIAINNSFETSITSSKLLIFVLYLAAVFFAGISFISYQSRESFLGYK